MKAIIAIDSFKGSMTSIEAGESVAKGIKRVFPDAITSVRPLADGGEGTVAALSDGMMGHIVSIFVSNPLGVPTKAEYGIIASSKTAVIEMSAAAGITLISDDEKNPMYTTTYGVGEIISDAISRGCRNFIIGIGGSATNDGGIGMLQALGFGLLDKDKNQVPFGARGLEVLDTITDDNIDPALLECKFNIACDVTNPLCGANGCSAVFGPQKGAKEQDIEKMNAWLLGYAEKAREKYPDSDKDFPGVGAAGGMGFAFLSFLGGVLLPGVDLILRETKLEDFIKDADIVITGEGRLDLQTAMGKAPAGVAALAKKYGKPVIAFAGGVTKDAKKCNEIGIDAFFPTVRTPCSLAEAMQNQNAKENLADTAEQAFRVLKIKV